MSVNINIKNHEKVFIDGYTGQRITDLKTKTPIYDNEDEVGNDTSNGEMRLEKLRRQKLNSYE